MEKTVTINGREYRMRASALIPRLYRYKFQRDMIADMRRLQKAYNKAMALPSDADEEAKLDAQFSALDLEIFENCAWLFMRHAGEDIPDTPDAWLDGIEGVFSIYEILPVVLDLWNGNMATTSTAKKK